MLVYLGGIVIYSPVFILVGGGFAMVGYVVGTVFAKVRIQH
jgi:hypothetical protein